MLFFELYKIMVNTWPVLGIAGSNLNTNGGALPPPEARCGFRVILQILMLTLHCVKIRQVFAFTC